MTRTLLSVAPRVACTDEGIEAARVAGMIATDVRLVYLGITATKRRGRPYSAFLV